MTHYVPSQTNATATPVQFLDANAPLNELFAYADLRIRTVRNMLKSLSCMTVRTLDDTDLGHFATAAYLLLETGCDALQVVEQRVGDIAARA